MNLLDALDREWRTLPYRRQHRRRYAAWCAEDPVLDQHPGLDLLIEAAHRERPYQANLILAALAARSPHDTLAARALLQAMLPGLRRLAAIHHWLALRPDLDAAVIAIAWEHIRSYPIERRPHRIAANLILDTGHHLRRQFPQTVPTSPLDDLVGIAAPEPRRHDLLDIIDDFVADHRLQPGDAELIIRTRHLDEPIADIAQRLGCTPNALRERRRRAETNLRAAV